jgi:hypothetical protein
MFLVLFILADTKLNKNLKNYFLDFNIPTRLTQSASKLQNREYDFVLCL